MTARSPSMGEHRNRSHRPLWNRIRPELPQAGCTDSMSEITGYQFHASSTDESRASLDVAPQKKKGPEMMDGQNNSD